MGPPPKRPASEDNGDCEEISEEAKKEAEERAARDQAIAKSVTSAAAALVRASNALPRTGDNYEVLASFPVFATLIEQQQRKVTDLLNRVLSAAGSRTRLPRLQRDEDAFVERVIEADDTIIERVGIVLDELDRAGRDAVVKVPKAIIDAESTRRLTLDDDHAPLRPNDAAAAGLLRTLTSASPMIGVNAQRAGKVSLTTAKPQLTYGFGASIDNSADRFVPRLRHKHHAMERRAASGLVVRDEEGASTAAAWTSDESTEEHPYAYENAHFEVPERQLASKEPISFRPLADTPLTTVDTPAALDALIKKLNVVTEFAVDIEAHTHRSFAGLICLVQISTRDEDFIVDPFPIWDEMHRLNEPFSDPRILKVFHGANSDVVWLQRDFGIFVRNLFDTYHGMKREGTFSKFSLAHLVQEYVGVTLQKEYQLADWRVRPLPADHVEYARCDAHYLLYAADRLRERLIAGGNEQRNLLKATYQDGVELCLKLYEKSVFDPDGYLKLIGTKRNFNNRQLYALNELWRWRDALAREEDESVEYVLPKHMMVHIAEALPREMQGILACCSPVPVLVKKHQLELHKLIYAARDRPLEKGVTLADRKSIGGGAGGRGLFEAMVDEANRMTRMKSILRSHLDFSHAAFNEEIGSLVRRVEKIETGGIEEKPIDDTFLSVIGVVKGKKGGGAAKKLADTEGMTSTKETKASASALAVLHSISAALDDWATPFERWQIASKAAEEKREKQRAAEAALRAEKGYVDKDGNKLYSHHDATCNRAPVFKTEPDEDDIDISGRKEKGGDGEDSGDSDVPEGTDVLGSEGRKRKPPKEWREEEILTKKKLKMLQKKRRADADIATDTPQGGKAKEGRGWSDARRRGEDEGAVVHPTKGTPPAKKTKAEVKKEEKEDEGEEGEIKEEEGEEAAVDYGAYDARAMFEQSQSAANARAYAPGRDSERGGGRGRGWRGAKKNRGNYAGGHTRARGASHSFRGGAKRGGGRGGGDERW